MPCGESSPTDCAGRDWWCTRRSGRGDHPVDLAVEDPEKPGTVLVAVETDGPAYAATSSTRDRDRLRPEQLERLGWGYVRVWSTDLFRDPARSVSRVHAAVARAAAAGTGGPVQDLAEESSADDGSGMADAPGGGAHGT